MDLIAHAPPQEKRCRAKARAPGARTLREASWTFAVVYESNTPAVLVSEALLRLTKISPTSSMRNLDPMGRALLSE